jgi:hypothetical protein
MPIEFSQIHNLVRTYQRILDVPSRARSRGDGTGRVTEDQVSISPQAREYEEQSRRDRIPGGLSPQDKERPR